FWIARNLATLSHVSVNTEWKFYRRTFGFEKLPKLRIRCHESRLIRQRTMHPRIAFVILGIVLDRLLACTFGCFILQLCKVAVRIGGHFAKVFSQTWIALCQDALPSQTFCFLEPRIRQLFVCCRIAPHLRQRWWIAWPYLEKCRHILPKLAQ